ncbi:MAG: hypothetical protein JWP63_4187 [Candidatus Solibacter sp.]|nr:hypothetical protein [Candidatus Solibacter sp.]
MPFPKGLPEDRTDQFAGRILQNAARGADRSKDRPLHEAKAGWRDELAATRAGRTGLKTGHYMRQRRDGYTGGRTGLKTGHYMRQRQDELAATRAGALEGVALGTACCAPTRRCVCGVELAHLRSPKARTISRNYLVVTHFFDVFYIGPD